MAFEGEHKIIQLKGIARAGADSVIEDGAMNEVIGLEYKDGSYVPYTGSTLSKLLPYWASDIYIHKTSTQNNIIIRSDDILFWMTEERFNATEDIGEAGNWSVLYRGITKDIELYGNIVCVSTDSGIGYYIFEPHKNSYEIYQSTDIQNKLPKLDLSVSMFDETANMKGAYNEGNLLVVRGTPVTKGGGNIFNSAGQLVATKRVVDFYGKGERSEVAQLARQANYILAEKGRLTGYVLALYAYRLKTNEYVFASAPVLLGAPKVNSNDEYELYLPKDEVYDTGENTRTQFHSEVKHYGTGYEWGEQDVSFTNNGVIAANYWGISAKLPEATSDVNSSIPCVFGWFHQSYGDNTATYTTDTSGFMVAAYGNILKFKITETISDELKPLIDSCCIFISEEISQYDFKADNVSAKKELIAGSSNVYKTCGYKFTRKTEEEIKDEIAKIKNFYKVHEIPFSEIKGGTSKNVDLEGKLGDNLVLQETLPLSAFDRTVVSNAKMKSYNFRLHIYDYKQRLAPPALNNYITGSGQYADPDAQENPYPAIACVKLKTLDGYSEVWGDVGYLYDNINPYITYPNKEAYEMDIYLNKGPSKISMTTVKLSPAHNGAYAYSLETLKYKNIQSEFQLLELPEQVNINADIERKNVIKVSETYSPNMFPLTNTYTIGDGNIVGLSNLSIALSQDTFGQYPLLVFCTDGVYSMNIDTTGNGVYTNVPPPFSREVCINSNSICEIDGAVLFASNKGLMVATSQGVQEYLPLVNGTPKHRPDGAEMRGLGMQLYGEVTDNNQIVKLTNSIDVLDFRDYLSDAETHVSYVSNKNKIIIYNKTKLCSYWIDIPTRNTTKLPLSIRTDNNDYPTELYVRSDNNHFMSFEQLSDNINTYTLIQTRPIKLQEGMKATLRVVLRGYFNSNEEDKWAVLLVLGSYDAINWQPIGIKKKSLKGGFNDIGCDTDRVSYKYMIVIFAASLNRDSHIELIELSKKNKYNNKLK